MRYILLFPVFLMGVGCSASNTEKDFLCEAQVGSPCATIASVDGTGSSAVTTLDEKPEDTAVKSLSQEPLFNGKKGGAGPLDGGFPYNATSYRKPEIVGTLWIAPILDDEGIFHEARFIHFVIQEARWDD